MNDYYVTLEVRMLVRECQNKDKAEFFARCFAEGSRIHHEQKIEAQVTDVIDVHLARNEAGGDL